MIKLQELLGTINVHSKVRIAVKGAGVVDGYTADKIIIDGDFSNLTWCDVTKYLGYRVINISAGDNGTLRILVDF